MADDRKPPNADLAAVAQGLCWADMPDGRCACFPAVCIATDPRYPYLHRALCALAADPWREAAIDFLIQWRKMEGLMPAEYKLVDGLLARAAAQVANE